MLVANPAIFRLCLNAIFVVTIVLCAAATSRGDMITISTSTPDGTADRAGNNDFVGLLSSVAPEQIGGQAVNFAGSLPAGEAFAVGDLTARDMDSTSGSRTWEYLLSLPGDAVSGTGWESILFTAHTYERGGNQLENNDELTWNLFLNTDTIAAASGTTGGNDFDTFDLTLSDPGGPTINQIRVVFTINGFNGGGEWFGTRGSLSAVYSAVPEPACAFWMIALAGCALATRRTS